MDPISKNIPPTVGLIPAAGLAKRLGLRGGSKELLPIWRDSFTGRTSVAGDFLLHQMVRAGCQRAFFIIRPGKWDIVEHFGHGAAFGCSIGYLIMDVPYGPPFSLGQALPFIDGACVLTGFPDILIDPPDACAQVIRHLHDFSADVVLATFPSGPDDGCDLAEVNAEGHIIKIVPKEYHPVWRGGSRTWLLAAWQPSFTAFFAEIIHTLRLKGEAMPIGSNPEWPLGVVWVEALKAGMHLQAVHFAKGRFLDIGTPERLAQARQFITEINAS